ncbi:chromosome segregation protein [Planctomycetes bacterium Pan216]|uniref:Chromosome segregation protein n=1 Tax=Kolteria novifilia TaxID=2527975 RepID=A0A518AWZ6_9BACT|nr:chromosome segregation protein [Planctomycetes bacterium Pan216]
MESRLVELEHRLARLEGQWSQDTLADLERRLAALSSSASNTADESLADQGHRLEQIEAELRRVADSDSRRQERIGELASLVESLATQTEEIGTQLAEVEIGALAEHVETLAAEANEQRQQHDGSFERSEALQRGLQEIAERLTRCEQSSSDESTNELRGTVAELGSKLEHLRQLTSEIHEQHQQQANVLEHVEGLRHGLDQFGERLQRCEEHASPEDAGDLRGTVEQLAAKVEQLQHVTSEENDQRQQHDDITHQLHELKQGFDQFGERLARCEESATKEPDEGLRPAVDELTSKVEQIQRVIVESHGEREQHAELLQQVEVLQSGLHEVGERLAQVERNASGEQTDELRVFAEGLAAKLEHVEGHGNASHSRLESLEKALAEFQAHQYASTENFKNVALPELATRLQAIAEKTVELESNAAGRASQLDQLQQHVSALGNGVKQRLEALPNQYLATLPGLLDDLSQRIVQLEPVQETQSSHVRKLEQLSARLSELESREQIDPSRFAPRESVATALTRLDEFEERIAKAEQAPAERGSSTSAFAAWAFAFLALMVAGGSLASSLWPQPVVSARKFVLQDADGIKRGEWAGEPTGSSLTLGDPQGGDRIGLVVSPEGATLALRDQGGSIGLRVSPEDSTLSMENRENIKAVSFLVNEAETRLNLAKAVEGEAISLLADDAGSALVLSDKTRSPRVMLLAHQTDDGVRVFDAQRRLRAGFGVSEDGPALNLWDAKGNRRAVLSANETGPALGFWSGNKTPRVMLGVSDSATSLLNLYDVQGKRRVLLDVSSEAATARFYDDSGAPLLTIPELPLRR